MARVPLLIAGVGLKPNQTHRFNEEFPARQFALGKLTMVERSAWLPDDLTLGDPSYISFSASLPPFLT